MRLQVPVVLFLPLLLVGCGAGPVSLPPVAQGSTLQGNVHGGQQPVGGAHVYLMAVNTKGYGGDGLAASTKNASTSLLSEAVTGFSDSVGAYVLTDGSGNFTVTGDYSCTMGQQVYFYVLGGNPGAGANASASFLATLGDCPSTGLSTFPASAFTEINEVTTVATAYSLAGFASDATHISSSGTGAGRLGMENAFGTVGNLVNPATGLALTTTPAGNGTVPTSTINTIADILAYCVNSGASSTGNGTVSGLAMASGSQSLADYSVVVSSRSGKSVSNSSAPLASDGSFSFSGIPAGALTLQLLDPTHTVVATVAGTLPAGGAFVADLVSGGSSTGAAGASPNCAALNAIATSNGVAGGGDAGTPASGTASAAINIAHHPTANVKALYALIPATPPFESVLSTQPADFTLAIQFTGGGLNYPEQIGIDALGNVWVTEFDYGSLGGLSEFSPLGAPTADSPYTGGGIDGPTALAIDLNGDVWLANSNGESLSEFTSGGTPLSGTGGFSLGRQVPYRIAIDGANSVWVASATSVLKQANDGVTQLGTYDTDSSAISIDGGGNAWIADAGGSSVIEISNEVVPKNPPAFYNSGIEEPFAIANDADGNAWVGNGTGGAVVKITSVYTAVFAGGGPTGSSQIAIDGNGNVWNAAYGLTELSNAGTIVSGSSGYLTGVECVGIALDGSGNAWVSTSSNTLDEVIGAAVPVVTPISLGVKNDTLGTRP